MEAIERSQKTLSLYESRMEDLISQYDDAVKALQAKYEIEA